MSRKLLNVTLAVLALLLLGLYILRTNEGWCNSINLPARYQRVFDIEVTQIDQKKGTARPRKREKLVIMTYMRSGSSLTGNIFQESPQVFYVYEPLWVMNKMWDGEHSVSMHLLDNSTKELPRDNIKALNLEVVHFLNSYLNCKLEELPIEMLLQWTKAKSRTLGKLGKCIGKNSTLPVIQKCTREITQECLEKPVSVIKIIRAGMQEMHALMSLDPDVKIVHLFRDPRGCMRSRALTAQFSWDEVRDAAVKLCSRVYADLEMSKVIQSHFPRRVLSVRYEDIVASPLDAARQLYDYVSLEFTPEVERWLWNSTYGGLPDNCNICSTRSNATETAYKWRNELKHFQHIMVEQEECWPVMEALGYRNLTTEDEMTNLAFPTTLEDYGETSLFRVKVKHDDIKRQR